MAKHRFSYERFVGSKPAGNVARCVHCGTLRLNVQGLDGASDLPMGSPFPVFRAPGMGGWSTYTHRCTGNAAVRSGGVAK